MAETPKGRGGVLGVPTGWTTWARFSSLAEWLDLDLFRDAKIRGVFHTTDDTIGNICCKRHTLGRQRAGGTK